jgi:peptide deformylase
MTRRQEIHRLLKQVHQRKQPYFGGTEMSIQEILLLGNPLLLEVCQEVADPTSPDVAREIQDLEDTLADFIRTRGFGRAIAAPQIGILRRILFLSVPQASLHGPMINPRIIWKSPETMRLWDDCFSFPDLMVKVERACAIRMEYLKVSGESVVLEAQNDLSELLQHEIDHLDGILSVHRAVDRTAFSLRSEWEKQGKPVRI